MGYVTSAAFIPPQEIVDGILTIKCAEESVCETMQLPNTYSEIIINSNNIVQVRWNLVFGDFRGPQILQMTGFV